QMRKRLTGEIELSRRQIEDAWHSHRQERQRQSALCARERQEIEIARRDVSQRQEQLASETGGWELRRQRLQMEVLGLETRIPNARLRLIELSTRDSADKASEGAPTAPATVHSDARIQPALDDAGVVALGQMAGDITDQRAHLVEQWQRLLQTRSAFEEERQQSL